MDFLSKLTKKIGDFIFFCLWKKKLIFFPIFEVRFTRQLSFKPADVVVNNGVTTTVADTNAPPKLRQYTLKEVAAHCTIDSCWMIIFDRVYDLTEFIEYHPGGYEIMIEYAGADATNAFNEKPHTIEASVMLEKYLIGELVQEDRMFRTWSSSHTQILCLKKNKNDWRHNNQLYRRVWWLHYM